MTPIGLLITFFLVVLASVSAFGYVFVIRPASLTGSAIPADLVLDERDLPAAQAAVAGAFRALGEVLPGAAQKDVSRQLLVAAGVAACASRVDSSEVGAGAKCGDATCADSEYCCDAKCGLCVPQEVACHDSCAPTASGGGM